MSHTTKPNEPAPICNRCDISADWNSKWGEWWCFRCDGVGNLIRAIEEELK